MIDFFVPGIPIPQGSKDPGGVRDANKHLRRWRLTVAVRALAHRQHPLWTGPVEMVLEFTFRRPQKPLDEDWVITKPDLDKLTRAIFDSLTDVIYDDDCRVCRTVTMKFYGEKPGVRIKARRLSSFDLEQGANR